MEKLSQPEAVFPCACSVRRHHRSLGPEGLERKLTAASRRRVDGGHAAGHAYGLAQTGVRILTGAPDFGNLCGEGPRSPSAPDFTCSYYAIICKQILARDTRDRWTIGI
jgi:hypothetical protein